jgi:hypothetical protein
MFARPQLGNDFMTTHGVGEVPEQRLETLRGSLVDGSACVNLTVMITA